MTASNDRVVRVQWIDTSGTFMDVNVPPGSIREAHTTLLYIARISNDLSFIVSKVKNSVNNKVYHLD